MNKYDQFKELLEENVQQLDEIYNNNRGRGIDIRPLLKDRLNDLGFNMNASTKVTNMFYPTSRRFNGSEPYNFNNYYTLDIRYPVESLIEAFKGGRDNYEKEFVSKIYNPGNMDEYIHEQLFYLLQKKIKEFQSKKKYKYLMSGDEDEEAKKELEERMEKELQRAENFLKQYSGSSIDDLLASGDPLIEELYDDLDIISIWVPPNDSGSQHVVMKKRIGERQGFVDLIMDGLTSASRGTVPLGVTIEEIVEGKFSRKPIMQDKGAYVNKIKDPTSDKPFSFRAISPEMLKKVHKSILLSFMDSKGEYISTTINVDLEAPNENAENVEESFNNIASNIINILTENDINELSDGENKRLGLGNSAIKKDMKRRKYPLVPFITKRPKYCDLVLYMEQEDFKKFEAGGYAGMKALKWGYNAMSRFKDHD